MDEHSDIQEIVASSGSHTLGRARPDRSGYGKEKTKYTVVKAKPIIFLVIC